MENIQNEADRDTFLRNIGLNVGDEIVSKVVNTLEGKSHNSLYALYSYGRRRDGTERKPVCGKGTVNKIKQLYEGGKLDPYRKYREKLSQKNKDEINNINLLKNKSELIERYNGKYIEEWQHYEQIKEAVIALQCTSAEERGHLLDQIERERVTLDDTDLQERLNTFVLAVEESAEFGLNIDSSLVARIISDTSQRMNKRYKQSK